jgi:hypothetical protein
MSYLTKNTAVAATLVTFGRRVLKTSCDNGCLVWELDSGDVEGEPDVGRAFLQHGYKREPVATMIRLANAREWLLKNVIHSDYETEAQPDAFVTSDMTLAACLVAQNFFLLAFRGRQFYFPSEAREIADRLRRDRDLDRQRQFLYQFSTLVHKAREAVVKTAC